MQAQDSIPLSDYIDTILFEQDRVRLRSSGHNGVYLNKENLKKYSSRNLAHVLQLESTLFVKNYGPSGISSLSGRGGGASHTAVLWEGFNIQSPMLGQADISLLPAIFVDYVEIQYGGESALFGSSSIGGALHLGTQSKFSKGWQFEGNLHGGTFEDWGQELKLSYSNNWYAGSVRSFFHSAKNNYPFRDINAFGSPKPIKELSNAAVKQFGIMQENLFKIKKHQLGLKLWYQDSERQIPPTLLNTSSSDLQKDASLRILANWKLAIGQQVWKARSAVFLEQLHFQNDLVNSISKVLSSITEVENKWYIHEQHILNIGLNYSFYKALSAGYSDSPEQHRAAIFVAYKISSKNKKWSSSLSLREELIDGQLITPAVSLGSSWSFYKKLNLKINLSHNYRLPTFNDLYWDLLGDPNLKPEYSWNSELGVELPFQLDNYTIKTNLTGFCNLVNDWILWSPDQAGFWRPSNVDQVWARGLEASFQVKGKWKKWQAQLGGNYAYTLSTRSKGVQTESIGKQLIYTPVHNANAHFQLQYDKTTLLYQHSFTSQRFADNLNNESLPFFHVGYLRLSQQVKLQKLEATFYAQINNLFGEDYQVVSNRTMPWQQVEIGVSISLN
jgi:vitamin B12 transporter